MGKLYPVGIQNFEKLRRETPQGRILVCGQDGADVPPCHHGELLFPESSETVWQESAHQYTGGVFSGEEGAVRGACGVRSGKGMGRVSDTASGSEHRTI